MISVKNLTKVYKTKHKEVRALNNVSFTLPDTGMIFIVGKSGSGKSTLLNMLSGLDKFTSGKIVSGGNSLDTMTSATREKYLSSYIGYVFQDYRLVEDFTVRQNVALAADISDSGLDPDDFIRLVGLEGYEDRLPKELSGGQKQRVAIARALVKNSKVILADEPTGNLDQTTTQEILQLLKSVSRNTLVLIVSHNLRDADEYADRIIELADGKVISDRSRIPNYNNNFSVRDGRFHLPHHKDLQKVDIGELLRRGRTSKGIVQAEGGFAPTKEIEYNGEKNNLHNKKMSNKNILKVFSVFFKRKWFSKAATVFMAAVILSVFYIIQALTLYNTGAAVINTLVNTDAYGVIVQASSGQASTDKYIGSMSEEKLQSLDDAYDGEMYRLYTEYLVTTPRGGGEDLVASAQNTLGFYSRITVGTLNTTEEYAKKLLEVKSLELLAGTLDKNDENYRPYGVAITDYTADSIIANYTAQNPLYSLDELGQPKSQEQLYAGLIGERSVDGKKTYINAIIDTNYEEKFREAKDMLSQMNVESSLENITTDPIYISFVSAVTERYNVTYSFDENYYEALRGYNGGKFNAYTYSVYLDDPAMAKEVFDVIEECGFSLYSGMVGNVHFIERCIDIFDKFFDITMIFILVACVFFLVNFGIKSIRSNIYEIGVIKAMGGIKKDISKIFISQSLLIGVGILIITYCGMLVGSYIANEVFLASLALVTNSNFYGIRAIDFYPLVALADIGIALVIVIVSAIISNKSIDRLNLISILKAKE